MINGMKFGTNLVKIYIICLIKNDYYIILCIKQCYITDCGAACIAAISKIREVAGTDKQGTNAYCVIKVA